MLITSLSGHMKKAAQGSLDISLNPVEDDDLNELAHSFNSIVSELKELNKKDKIIKQLERDSSGDLFNLGVNLLKEKNYNDAIAIFKALTIIKPNAFGSFFNLGVAYAKKKEYGFSFDMFERALNSNPGHELTLNYIEKVKRLQETDAKISADVKR